MSDYGEATGPESTISTTSDSVSPSNKSESDMEVCEDVESCTESAKTEADESEEEGVPSAKNIDAMLRDLDPIKAQDYFDKHIEALWDKQPIIVPWVIDRFGHGMAYKPPATPSGLNDGYTYQRLNGIGSEIRPSQQIPIHKDMALEGSKGFLPGINSIYTFKDNILMVWDFTSQDSDPKVLHTPSDITFVVEISIRPDVATEKDVKAMGVVVASANNIFCFGLRSDSTNWIVIWDITVGDTLTSIATSLDRVFYCTKGGIIHEIQYLVQNYWSVGNNINVIAKLPEAILHLKYEPACEHLFGLSTSGAVYVFNELCCYTMKKGEVGAASAAFGLVHNFCGEEDILKIMPLPTPIPMVMCYSRGMARILIKADTSLKSLHVVHVRAKPSTKNSNVELHSFVVLDLETLVVFVNSNGTPKTALVHAHRTDSELWLEKITNLELGCQLEAASIDVDFNCKDDQGSFFILTQAAIYSYKRMPINDVIKVALKEGMSTCDELLALAHIKQLALSLVQIMLMPETTIRMRKNAAAVFYKLDTTSACLDPKHSTQLEALLSVISQFMKAADTALTLSVVNENTIKIHGIGDFTINSMVSHLGQAVSFAYEFIQSKDVCREDKTQTVKIIYALEQSIQVLSLLQIVNCVQTSQGKNLPPLEEKSLGKWLSSTRNTCTWSHQLLDVLTGSYCGSVNNKYGDAEDFLTQVISKCCYLFSIEKYLSTMADLKFEQCLKEKDYLKKCELENEIVALLLGALPDLNLKKVLDKLIEIDRLGDVIAVSISYVNSLKELNKDYVEGFAVPLEVISDFITSASKEHNVKGRMLINWVLEQGDKEFLIGLMKWLTNNNLIQAVLKPNSLNENSSKIIEDYLSNMLEDSQDGDFYQATKVVAWYFEAGQKPADAVAVYISSAEDGKHSFALEQRQNLLSDALTLARTCKRMWNTRNAVAKMLSLAELQTRLLKEAEEVVPRSSPSLDLSHGLMDAQSMFAYAKENNLPQGELLLHQQLKIGDADRIKAIWDMLICKYLGTDRIGKLIEVGMKLDGKYLPLDVVIYKMEDTANSRHLDDIEALGVLMQIANWQSLIKSYLNVLNLLDCWSWTKNRIVSSSLILISSVFDHGNTEIVQMGEAHELLKVCQENIKAHKMPHDKVYEKLHLCRQILGMLPC